jgi:hypothetical protein
MELMNERFQMLSKIVRMTVDNERKCCYYKWYVSEKQFEYLNKAFDEEKYDVKNKNLLERFRDVINYQNEQRSQSSDNHSKNEIRIISFEMDPLALEKIKDVFENDITGNDINSYCIKINKLIIKTFHLWQNDTELFKKLIAKFQDLQFISDDCIHPYQSIAVFLTGFNNSISNIKCDLNMTQINELLQMLNNIQG